MNWEALGAIGEIVGAVGVIVTLGYLAVQIRQNTRWLRASIADSHYKGVVDWVTNIASDRELGRTYFVGIQRFEGLSEEDQRQFFLLIYSQLKLHEQLHYQFSRGNIEEELWNLEAASLHLLIHSPVFEAWWEARRSLFRGDFQREIERLRGEEAHIYSEQLRNAMAAKLSAAHEGAE
jgi:hypothetical protein